MPTVEREKIENNVGDPRSSWFAFCWISSPSSRSVQAPPDPSPFHSMITVSKIMIRCGTHTSPALSVCSVTSLAWSSNVTSNAK